MIKGTCSNCGSSMGVYKTILVSKSIPVRCNKCGCRQIRKHDASRVIAYLGGSIGLFGLLFLYISKGVEGVGVSLSIYLLLLLVAYVIELFLFDLFEYTDQEESQAIDKSKRNIYIALAIVSIGVIFYVFDV